MIWNSFEEYDSQFILGIYWADIVTVDKLDVIAQDTEFDILRLDNPDMPVYILICVGDPHNDICWILTDGSRWTFVARPFFGQSRPAPEEWLEYPLANLYTVRDVYASFFFDRMKRHNWKMTTKDLAVIKKWVRNSPNIGAYFSSWV